jgi:hypothetical protein
VMLCMKSIESEVKKSNYKFTKIMKWIGIILTGLSGVVWLGGNKIGAGFLLIFTMIFMVLPIKHNKTLRRIRIGFACLVFCLVIWNITQTEIPSDYDGYSTGIRFFDQVLLIFNGFLKGQWFKST